MSEPVTPQRSPKDMRAAGVIIRLAALAIASTLPQEIDDDGVDDGKYF